MEVEIALGGMGLFEGNISFIILIVFVLKAYKSNFAASTLDGA